MPSATWNSGASTDMNNTANYSAVWDATYDLVWDATSVVNCTATAPVSCNSITVAAAYSGAWSISGQTLTVAVGASWDGTGALNLGNGVTANGASGTVHVGAGVGVATTTSCALTMNGTTGMTLDLDKAIVLKTITLGAGALVTSSGIARVELLSNGIPFVLNNNSRFTANMSMEISRTTDGDLWAIGTGVTFNGTCSYIQSTNNGAGKIINIPIFSFTGATTFWFTINAFTFNGFSIGSNNARIYGTSATITTTFTGTYALGILSIGNALAGSATYNIGSSIFTIGSYDATYNTGTIIINFQTSTWSCSGNWTYGSNHTINPGTSTVTITNTSTVTSSSKTFYNFAINAAAKTITLSGSLTIASGGSVTVTAFTAFAGNQYIIFNGSGSITISTNVSNRLRTAVAGSTITWNTGANVWTFPAYTANDFGGSASGNVTWQSSSAGTQFRIAAPAATITVSYMTFGDANNSVGGTIYAIDGTSIDNGNNVNIEFPAKNAKISTSKISINMGM